jgi:Uma2 family endonuclease
MRMKPARRPARYDELLKVPDTKVAEILDGELFVSPRPASPHAFAASAMGADLIGGFQRPPGDPLGPGGWWLLDEPELHFGDDVLVPDQAGWRRSRMPTVPNVAAFTQAPDWACEVASPSTARIDRSRKMRIYAREGVGHLWIVEPVARTIEVYRLEHGQWVVAAVHGGDDPARLEPFDAIELDVRRWWLESAMP